MNTHSISRRQFAHLLGVGAAAAIVRPRITIAKESTVPAPANTGVVFALALAFGLGGREWAAEFLERWWPRKKRP